MKLIGTFIIGSIWALDATASNVEVKIEQIADAVHLELTHPQADQFKVEQTKTGELTLQTTDLEPAAADLLKLFKDPLIKQINTSANQTDGRTLITLFPKKSGTLDWFAYVADQPRRYIVDVYLKKGAVLETQPIAKIEQQKGKSADNSELVIKPAARTPASEFDLEPIKQEKIQIPELQSKSYGRFGVFDGADADFSRFKLTDDEINPEAIKKSARNIYLKFPMLESDLKYLGMLQSTFPIYRIIEKPGEENRIARMLLTLFEGGRHAVFEKVYEIFNQKYANSEYNEMIQFMRADLAYSLWQKSKNSADYQIALDRYTEATKRFPKSELVERTVLLKGFTALAQKDFLGVIKNFRAYLDQYPDSLRAPEVKFALGVAHLKLNKIKEAQQHYENAREKHPERQYQIEAAYRMGDIFIASGDYQKAVSEYQSAFSKYPDDWNQFPNAFYNSAEALFWLGKYKEASEVYLDFIRRFPDHLHSAYAMTRIGEIIDIVGASEKKALGAWLETYFRYGETPGAHVARMRFLSRRMGEAKGPELNEILADIAKAAEASDLPQVNEFREIIISDGYSRRSEFDNAMTQLRTYFEKYPSEGRRKLFRQLIEKHATAAFVRFTQEQKPDAALALYDKYKASWLKDTERIDLAQYVGDTYQDVGLFSNAAQSYEQAINTLERYSQQPEKLKEKEYFEAIPTKDSLLLRLATTRLREGKDKVALSLIRRIPKESSLSPEEKVQLSLLTADISENIGNMSAAIENLEVFAQTFLGDKALLVATYVRLGDLNRKQAQIVRAQEHYEMAIKLFNPDLASTRLWHGRAMERVGQIYADTNRPKAAEHTWRQLLSTYGNQGEFDSVRFKLGKIYFAQGKLKEASLAWEPLSQSANQLWNQLAQEQMQSRKWADEYRKYTDRIPAMASDNKSNTPSKEAQNE